MSCILAYGRVQAMKNKKLLVLVIVQKKFKNVVGGNKFWNMSSKYLKGLSKLGSLPNEHSFLALGHHRHYRLNESTLSPPKIVVASIIFFFWGGDRCGHHILGYFCLFYMYLIKFRHKLTNAIKKSNKHWIF